MYTVVIDGWFCLVLPFPPDIAKKSARSAPYTVWVVCHKVLILLAALEFGLATMQLLLQRERGMSWARTGKTGRVVDSDNQPSRSAHRRTLVEDGLIFFPLAFSLARLSVPPDLTAQSVVSARKRDIKFGRFS